MKKILILFILILALSGCKRTRYVSISRPQISTSSSNHYFVSDGTKEYQGNESVKDINDSESNHDILIVEDDGTYHYIK